MGIESWGEALGDNFPWGRQGPPSGVFVYFLWATFLPFKVLAPRGHSWGLLLGEFKEPETACWGGRTRVGSRTALVWAGNCSSVNGFTVMVLCGITELKMGFYPLMEVAVGLGVRCWVGPVGASIWIAVLLVSVLGGGGPF